MLSANFDDDDNDANINFLAIYMKKIVEQTEKSIV